MSNLRSKFPSALCLVATLVAGTTSGAGAQNLPRPLAPKGAIPATTLICSADAPVDMIITGTSVPLRISVEAVPVPSSKATDASFDVQVDATPITRELRRLVGLTTVNPLTGQTFGPSRPAASLRVAIDSRPEDGGADVRGSIACGSSHATISGEPGRPMQQTYLVRPELP